MEKFFHANRKQKKVGVAILISDTINLKIKNITRDKEGYYIMIKGSVQEILNSLPQDHSSKASILLCSAFFIV